VIVKKINYYKYGEGGEELKVPYHASTAAAYDGNMPHVKATCLTSRQHASNNSRLPLFPTVIIANINKALALKKYTNSTTKVLLEYYKHLITFL
jgi:hypothetical protein